MEFVIFLVDLLLDLDVIRRVVVSGCVCFSAHTPLYNTMGQEISVSNKKTGA